MSGHRATNKFIPLMFNPAGTQNQGGIQNRGRCGFCSIKKNEIGIMSSQFYLSCFWDMVKPATVIDEIETCRDSLSVRRSLQKHQGVQANMGPEWT